MGVRNGAMFGEAHDFSPVRVGRIRNHTPARTWDELAWTFRYSTDSSGSLQLFLLRWWFYGIIPLKPWSCRQECFSCFWRRELIFISPVPGNDFAIFFSLQNHLLWFSFFFRAQYFLISQYVQSSFQTSHFSWVQHVPKKMTSTSQINCKIIWRGTNSHTSSLIDNHPAKLGIIMTAIMIITMTHSYYSI